MTKNIRVPKGYVIVGCRIQSLWQGHGWYAKPVCVRSGETPVIATVGNLYVGERTWDIERKSDMGAIECGFRTRSPKRMVEWLARRSPEDMPEEYLYSDIDEAIQRRLR